MPMHWGVEGGAGEIACAAAARGETDVGERQTDLGRRRFSASFSVAVWPDPVEVDHETVPLVAIIADVPAAAVLDEKGMAICEDEQVGISIHCHTVKSAECSCCGRADGWAASGPFSFTDEASSVELSELGELLLSSFMCSLAAKTIR